MPGLFCSVLQKGSESPMSTAGPKTAAGKAAVSQNAVKHGIFSQEPVVKDVESQEEWERHREGIIASLCPVGALEETLAERAARLLWRQARVARFEMYCIDRWQQEIPDDLKFKYQLEVGTTSPEARTNCSPAQIRAIHQQRQQFLLLMRRFPELADDAFLLYEEAKAIAEAVLEAVQDQDGLTLVGEPGEQPEDLPRVRVGTLRAGLRQVAKRAGLDLADVWARAAQQAIAAAAWQQERYERLEGYFPVWHAYRVVPREQELEKVMRYEAHLSRELARLLKDFHLLQKQRRAAVADGERGKGKGEMEAPDARGERGTARTPSGYPASEGDVGKGKGEKETPQPSAPTVYPLDGSPSGTDTPAASSEGTAAPEAGNGKTDGEAGAPATFSEEPESPEAGVPDANPCPIWPTPSRYLGPGKGWANRGHTAEASPRRASNHSHRPRHKGRRM
jgi:hypothetical protein